MIRAAPSSAIEHKSNLHRYPAAQRAALRATGIVGRTPQGVPIISAAKLPVPNPGRRDAAHLHAFLCPFSKPDIEYVHYHGESAGFLNSHCPHYDGVYFLELAADQ